MNVQYIIFALLVQNGLALKALWSDDFSTYRVVHKRSSEATSFPLSFSSLETLEWEGANVAIFMEGYWCIANLPAEAIAGKFRRLSLVNTTSSRGSHQTLGPYSKHSVLWQCSIRTRDDDYDSTASKDTKSETSPTVQVSILNFDSGGQVIFDIKYPNGANNTSTIRNEHGTINKDESSHDGVSTNFPAFCGQPKIRRQPREGQFSTTRFPNQKPASVSALSWEGSFVQSVRRQSRGPRGGPTLWYHKQDPSLSTVLIGSPWNNWKSFSSGNGTVSWNKGALGNGCWAPGVSGRIEQIPKGYRQSIILHLENDGGITNALYHWGQLVQKNFLQQLSTPQQRISDAWETNQSNTSHDVTLDKIGYQTDNGAYYCFCKDVDCSQVLIDTLGMLKTSGVPMGYLSFQGSGASSGRGTGAAPWCIDTWGVDGGLGPQYPMALDVFDKVLGGIRLQLYAPYFCPHSEYFQPNFTRWMSVESDTSLPGCDIFAFKDVHPSQSRDFYDWFFDKGARVGMTSFEPDFMNQNHNCVPEFIHSATSVDEWQQGMADAALSKNIHIQWCYATPSDVLASAGMPAVTNFRVSFDYCYGGSWMIGESSLLVWSLGKFPSKDTLWTTDNGRTETPGCDWTPDHETAAAELHVVLALLSTGPVGISDGYGMSNIAMLKRTVMQDGTLLKPSKAITAIDSSYLSEDAGGVPSNSYVYTTYTQRGPSWMFVSFQLEKRHAVRILDFWPPLSSTGRQGLMLLAYRLFDEGQACRHGERATSTRCVDFKLVTDIHDITQPVYEARQSPTGKGSPAGSQFTPDLVTVWQQCPENGWFFLGELGKYVALSSNRFEAVKYTETGVSVDIVGIPGEQVTLTALAPRQLSGTSPSQAPSFDIHEYYVIKKSIIIPSNGRVKVNFTEILREEKSHEYAFDQQNK